MSRFQFRLDSLLRFRIQRRDLCRRLLAEILEEVRQFDVEHEELLAGRQEVMEEIRRMSASGPVAVDRIAGRRYRVGDLKMQAEQLLARREIKSAQLAACRQALTDADQAVRLLERLRETQHAEFLVSQEHAEAREREDAWQGLQLTRGWS